MTNAPHATENLTIPTTDQVFLIGHHDTRHTGVTKLALGLSIQAFPPPGAYDPCPREPPVANPG